MKPMHVAKSVFDIVVVDEQERSTREPIRFSVVVAVTSTLLELEPLPRTSCFCLAIPPAHSPACKRISHQEELVSRIK